MSRLVVSGCGDKLWYNENGDFHNENGPALDYTNGSKHWYINGIRHRVDGPASEYYNGTKFWFYNGKPHREDGPAIEYFNGDKVWYYHGRKIDCNSIEEFLRIVKLKAFW